MLSNEIITKQTQIFAPDYETSVLAQRCKSETTATYCAEQNRLRLQKIKNTLKNTVNFALI